MSKSYAPKDAARKRRGTRRKATSKVIAEKARDKHPQTRPKVMTERNSLPAIAIWEVGDAHRCRPIREVPRTQVPDTMRGVLRSSIKRSWTWLSVTSIPASIWQWIYAGRRTLRRSWNCRQLIGRSSSVNLRP